MRVQQLTFPGVYVGIFLPHSHKLITNKSTLIFLKNVGTSRLFGSRLTKILYLTLHVIRPYFFLSSLIFQCSTIQISLIFKQSNFPIVSMFTKIISTKFCSFYTHLFLRKVRILPTHTCVYPILKHAP